MIDTTNDATIALISDQALMRHQYQRRIRTSPVPAPIASRNFHACSTDESCDVTTIEAMNRQHCRPARHGSRSDARVASRLDEPLVEIVDEIRSAPVEVRANCRHVRGSEAGHHHAAATESAAESTNALHVTRFACRSRFGYRITVRGP